MVTDFTILPVSLDSEKISTGSTVKSMRKSPLELEQELAFYKTAVMVMLKERIKAIGSDDLMAGVQKYTNIDAVLDQVHRHIDKETKDNIYKELRESDDGN